MMDVNEISDAEFEQMMTNVGEVTDDQYQRMSRVQRLNFQVITVCDEFRKFAAEEAVEKKLIVTEITLVAEEAANHLAENISQALLDRKHGSIPETPLRTAKGYRANDIDYEFTPILTGDAHCKVGEISADKCRALWKASGKTLYQIGKEGGFSHKTLEAWLSKRPDKPKAPAVLLMDRFAYVMGVLVDELRA